MQTRRYLRSGDLISPGVIERRNGLLGLRDDDDDDDINQKVENFHFLIKIRPLRGEPLDP